MKRPNENRVRMSSLDGPHDFTDDDIHQVNGTQSSRRTVETGADWQESTRAHNTHLKPVPLQVRAPLQSDIELLVLDTEVSEELFRDCPEQQETINGNVFMQFGMDSKGDNVDNESVEADGDPDEQVLLSSNLI